MAVSFPLAVQAAYQDLLEAHRLRRIADIPGAPYLKEADGRKYWYAQQRIGDRPVDKYLGPDSEALRERIEKARAEQETQKTFERRCGALVAQLRAARLPALDRTTGKILNAMARVGAFRLGGTLVGTHAFRLYSAELGARFSDEMAATEDVDVAAFENLKLVIDDKVDPALGDTFKALALEPAPGLDRKQRPTRWRMSGGGAIVDFLAPQMRADRDVVKLEALGVYAQALGFLNFLIAEPIEAVALYRSGVLVQIPRPERYAVHKLIVAERRDASAAAKAVKDLAQAEALISVLAEDRPGELAAAYEDALTRGPKWRAAINKSLKRRPGIKEVLSGVL